jgi:FtsP/CotA-like multicopper oxidase with cupredoxin domain
MKITRREFIKRSAGLAAGFCLPFGLGTLSPASARRTVKEFHFTASPARIYLGEGPDFKAWTYNGQVPGPEIRVKDGEIVRVVLKNLLDEGTSIHWHGIPLPNPMDGVPGITQPAVKSGETFVYEFEARPAGTFLYHSHARYQLDQGLYGSLIIEPQREPGSYDREHTLVLEDWVMRDGGGTADVARRPPMGMMHGRRGRRQRLTPLAGPLWEPVYDGYAVNGKVGTAIDPIVVRKGDRVKLRLINAASATVFYLRLAGHTFTIIASDGNPIRPIQSDILQIGMGERYDVVVAADNPGHWLLGAANTGLGEDRLAVPVIYEGIQQKTAEPPSFHRGLKYATYADFESLVPTAFSAGQPDRIYNQPLSGGMHSDAWAINGQVYPKADPLMVRAGERVRLRYGNQSMMAHPMHLHGHFFRLVNPAVPPERWALKDTLLLDHMQRFDVEFIADNPGKWFHHCHNLYHMEAGMANVVVYDDPSRDMDL